MSLGRKPALIILFVSLAFLPTAAFASVEITEVMHNPEGSDSGREWVELKNTGNSAVNLDGWRFREDETDHLISTSSYSGHTDSLTLSSGGYIILADDPNAFAQDFPNVSAVLDSAFTLVNSGEPLAAVDPSDTVTDSVNYDTSIGGDDNGNSLQRTDSGWITAQPTPAKSNASQSDPVDKQDEDSSGSEDNASESTSGNTARIMEPRERNQDDSEDHDSSEEDTEEKTITVNAGSDMQAIAGVQIHLAGTVTSSDPELLEGRSVRWSLGNGDTKDGADIFYTYDHPDTYTATLMVKNSSRTISDQITITVSSPELSIASTSAGSDGFIKIANDLNRDVNLAGWHLRTVDGTQTLPDYTIVPAQDSLTIANQGTGFVRVAQANLLYPDGTVADSYQPAEQNNDTSEDSTNEVISEPQSTATSESAVTKNTESTEDTTTPSQQQSLNELFATNSQQAAAGAADPGSMFWRWALLLVALVVAALGVIVGIQKWAPAQQQEDKLSDTFNINEI